MNQPAMTTMKQYSIKSILLRFSLTLCTPVCNVLHFFFIPMDEAKMQDIANRFAYAAREAKQYGFDLILLHFGHGWLIHQFLSPFFHSRTDKYCVRI